MFKALADDTRLRILQLVSHRELTVTQICRLLRKKQSLISKHLTRLRYAGIVSDRREGVNVYYYLLKQSESERKVILNAATKNLANVEDMRKDFRALKRTGLNGSAE